MYILSKFKRKYSNNSMNVKTAKLTRLEDISEKKVHSKLILYRMPFKI